MHEGMIIREEMNKGIDECVKKNGEYPLVHFATEQFSLRDVTYDQGKFLLHFENGKTGYITLENARGTLAIIFLDIFLERHKENE